MTMFSVIIPTLNEEKFLPYLLESLIQQTYRDFEIIVVDGTSKDKTVEVAEGFQKKLPRLRIVVSPKASLPLQRNIGARHARGTWFVFVDADSVLLSYFFERVNLFIHTYQPQLVTTWCRPDSENSRDAIMACLFNLVDEASLIIKRAYPPGPLSLVTKEAFESVGGYDEERAYNEDVDFGIRLAKRGVHMSVIKESLYVWSLRRLRKDGALKLMQQYIISAMPILFLNKSLKFLPGYVMGGHIYDKKRQVKRSLIREYRLKLKKLTKEFFR